MYYRITATINYDGMRDHGGNVADWFREPTPGVSIFDTIYMTADDAQTAAETSYLGPDVDGIGVTWKVEEADID